MQHVAITGSFSSGKSYLLNYIKTLGYKVFSCDEYIKLLYQNPQIVKKILQEIGGFEEFSTANLANVIYSDSIARAKLENIIHPLVIEGIKNFTDQYRNETLIFTEIPLLYEANLQEYFNKVICITCPLSIRMQRAKLRGYNEEFFKKIDNVQLPEANKMMLADFILASDESIETNFKKIIEQMQ